MRQNRHQSQSNSWQNDEQILMNSKRGSSSSNNLSGWHCESPGVMKNAAKLSDLCEEDKAKIGNILKQLSNEAEEKRVLYEQLAQMQANYEGKISQMRKHSEDVYAETRSFRKEFKDSIRSLEESSNQLKNRSLMISQYVNKTSKKQDLSTPRHGASESENMQRPQQLGSTFELSSAKPLAGLLRLSTDESAYKSQSSSQHAALKLSDFKSSSRNIINQNNLAESTYRNMNIKNPNFHNLSNDGLIASGQLEFGESSITLKKKLIDSLKNELEVLASSKRITSVSQADEKQPNIIPENLKLSKKKSTSSNQEDSKFVSPNFKQLLATGNADNRLRYLQKSRLRDETEEEYNIKQNDNNNSAPNDENNQSAFKFSKINNILFSSDVSRFDNSKERSMTSSASQYSQLMIQPKRYGNSILIDQSIPISNLNKEKKDVIMKRKDVQPLLADSMNNANYSSYSIASPSDKQSWNLGSDLKLSNLQSGFNSNNKGGHQICNNNHISLAQSSSRNQLLSCSSSQSKVSRSITSDSLKEIVSCLSMKQMSELQSQLNVKRSQKQPQEQNHFLEQQKQKSTSRQSSSPFSSKIKQFLLIKDRIIGENKSLSSSSSNNHANSRLLRNSSSSSFQEQSTLPINTILNKKPNHFFVSDQQNPLQIKQQNSSFTTFQQTDLEHVIKSINQELGENSRTREQPQQGQGDSNSSRQKNRFHSFSAQNESLDLITQAFHLPTQEKSFQQNCWQTYHLPPSQHSIQSQYQADLQQFPTREQYSNQQNIINQKGIPHYPIRSNHTHENSIDSENQDPNLSFTGFHLMDNNISSTISPHSLTSNINNKRKNIIDLNKDQKQKKMNQFDQQELISKGNKPILQSQSSSYYGISKDNKNQLYKDEDLNEVVYLLNGNHPTVSDKNNPENIITKKQVIVDYPKPQSLERQGRHSQMIRQMLGSLPIDSNLLNRYSELKTNITQKISDKSLKPPFQAPRQNKRIS